MDDETISVKKRLADVKSQEEELKALLEIVEEIKKENKKVKDTEKGYKLVGDAHWESISSKISAATPVPGGVGPMTIAMLVENTVEGDAISYAIVGIGINIAMDTSQIPEIAPIATSLDRESGQILSPAKILRRVLQELDKLYIAVSEGVSPVEEWRGHLETLGKRVTIQWGNEVVAGLAEGVNDTGHLLLRRDDGVRVDLPGGEVTFQILSEDLT